MPELYQERQIAVKLRIKEIGEGDYMVEEGWKPNYLLTKKGEKVSRVNLMGVVLDKEENGKMINLVLDDGSGKIMVRSFEEIKNLGEAGVGEGVLVIGRIRIYNQEKYISPEIVKKIDKGWLKVRAKELERERGGEKEGGKGEEEENKRGEREGGEAKEEEIFDSGDKKVVELIKGLDKGEGALIGEVEEKLGKGGERIIEEMLKKGEIFQNLPGRVKVL